MRDKDFLDEFAEADVEPAEMTVEVEAEAPVDTGPKRGPDGKFVRREAEAKAEAVETGAKEAVEADLTEPPSDEEEGQSVPLSVVKALRKELQELKKKAQGTTTQSQQSAPEIRRPTVAYEQDPQAYMRESLISQKTQMSMFMASQSEGEEVAQAAWAAFDEACRRDPLVSQWSYQLLEHPHPVGEMVKWYKEQQMLNEIRSAGSIEALVQARMQQMGQAAPQVAQKPNVPPSLAGSGKARASEATGEPVDGFEALFRR